MTPFDYVKAINEGKSIDIDEQYVPFIVNRAFSYFPDTIFQAHAMSINNFLDRQMQFDYLSGSIKKKKRFAKWVKKSSSDGIQAIQDYYGFSYQKALQVSTILSAEQIQQLIKTVNRGGVITKK